MKTLRSCLTGHLTTAIVAITLCGGIFPSNAVSADWLTGAKLRQQLARPVDVVWPDNPLRESLQSLSRAQGVAVLMDRRVDPDQKVRVELHDMPLQQALEAIAQSRQLGISQVGPIVYVGPPEVAAVLRTIVELRLEDAHRLPPAAAKKLLSPRDISWAELSEPRELLGQLARQCGFALEGSDRVPHDLWPAADLPAVSALEGLSLIAAQFGLTFAFGAGGDSVSLLPMPDAAALVRSYPGGSDPQATAAKYAVLAPLAQIKVVGQQVYVKGLWEDHQQITSPKELPTRPTSPKPSGDRFANKRFTIKSVQQPLGPLLKQLAAQLALDLKVDAAAMRVSGVSLDQRVSFSVENATVDELLREVFKPTRLKVRRQGDVVEIGPAGP